MRKWLRADDERHWRAKLAPHICMAIVFALNLAFYAKAAPTLRLVELTVCREYYAEHDPGKIGEGGFVDEQECKMAAVQKKVAWLFTADELLHFVCDFVATIPLGILAEHIGPKPVMLLNFIGLILSWAWLLVACTFYHTFRSEMVLLASVFCLFGGATHFNTSIIYSEAALYTKDRTTVFSLLEFCIQIGQLIGPVIGSALLLLGLYQPFYFVFPVSLLSIPLALLLPSRTRNPGHRKRKLSDNGSSRDHETQGLLNTSNGEEGESSLRHPTPVLKGYESGWREAWATAWLGAKKSWKLLLDYRVIQYGYAASLIITLGKQALHILLQYVSKRFGVSIAEAGFLFSIKAVVVIVLYLIIIPVTQRRLQGSRSSITMRLARASILHLLLGTIIMGLAWDIGVLIPGLIIYALGFGFPITVRTLLSDLATAHDLPIPIIFSGSAIAETAGSFIGATALTGAFTRTLDLGGWVRGIPFLICSVFYFMIAVPTWFAHLSVEVETVEDGIETGGERED